MALTVVSIALGCVLTAMVAVIALVRRQRRRIDFLEGEIDHIQQQALCGRLGIGITHEAKNALTGIIGFTQLLMHQRSPEKLDSMLELIYGESKRCLELMVGFLELARGAPATEVDMQQLDPASLVNRVWRLTHHHCEQHEIQLNLEVDDELPSIHGNENQLVQVLLNIVMNAQRELSAGGNITLAAQNGDSDGCRISVRDDGAGIHPDLHEKIFDPSFTSYREKGGSGMGLAVSRDIITAHGGTLGLESAPGQGAIFTIDLPAAGGNPASPTAS